MNETEINIYICIQIKKQFSVDLAKKHNDFEYRFRGIAQFKSNLSPALLKRNRRENE